MLILIYGVVFFLLNKFYDVFSVRFPKILPFYNTVYTFLEYLSFTLILLFNVEDRRFRIGVYVSLVLFAAFQILFLVTVLTSQAKDLDAVPIGVETILIYICIFYFFFDRFKNAKNEYIYNDHGFWVSIGLMLYLGGSFFFYILANHMARTELDKYWFITWIIETFKNILFAIAIIVYARNKSKNKINNQNIPYLDFN